MNHEIRRTSPKLHQRLDLVSAHRARESVPIEIFELCELSGPEVDPLIWLETADPAGWRSIPWGSTWGRPRTDFVLHSRFTVPVGWGDDTAADEVRLRLPIGRAGDFSHPEALVYVDGVPLAACDRHHQELRLPARFCDGTAHELVLHGWTGGVPEVMGPRRSKPPLVMSECSLERIDRAVARFEALARVALGVADQLDLDDPNRAGLYDALDAAFLTLDTREPLGDRFFESATRAGKQLRTSIDALGPALPVDVFAVGHAHIDVAWLWTVAQTRRKAGRTFHNVLALMDESPEFHFTQSQPQLYDYVRQDYPELFSAIGEQVAAGRWEAIGGMWVEADCNLTGSESLARQFLLGRRFFAEHFGPEAESAVLWLPDVFGYAWNLPQLIKAAGLDYFFTIKISWSQYNRLPYDSFWWQGLDGTRVLTHFSPTPNDSHPAWATYNAEARPVDVLDTWRQHRQREVRSDDGTAAPMLLSYGHGDGGGGPTREMVENLTGLEAFPSMPRTRTTTVKAFFAELEKVADRLPVWNGELYLEYHRGTYTSQAATKWGNRRGEFGLHNAEFLAAWARLLTDADYPAARLTEAWKLLCLNQFHDIIPGSSIGEVYQDTAADHRRIADLVSETVTEAVDALARVLPGSTHVVIVNPNPVAVTDLVFVADGEDGPDPADEAGLVDLGTGAAVREQPVDGGRLLALDPIPAYSLRALGLATGVAEAEAGSSDRTSVEVRAIAGGFELVNSRVRAVLDGDGQVVELVDLELGRSVLPDGATGNRLQVFEDRPLDFDAWDIEIYYEDRQWAPESAHSAEIVEHGPLRAAVRFERRLGASTIAQTVALRHDSKRIDFVTDIDWHERHTLLKVAFPVEVHADHATFDIQWGNVARPVHTNTSWNWAQFETCAHKWADLSEGDFGVSLLNDGKYGHDVRDNVLRLTLLRSPGAPDPEADEGRHRFTYSILPHQGDWRSTTAAVSSTVAEAYALNNPLLVTVVTDRSAAEPDRSGLPVPLISVDRPNVVVETVKWAEDGDGLIVRLYDNERRRGPVRVRIGFPFERIEAVDLLERPVSATPVERTADGFEFMIAPYQIKTFRII